MPTFSPALIARLQKYFQDRYGQTLTTEQAVVFLSSLADLWELVDSSSAKVETGIVSAADAKPQRA